MDLEVPQLPSAEGETMSDPVNHPAYYKGDYVMRIIEDFGLNFHRGTVVKYLLRAGSKPGDAEIQDLEKARWYLDRLISNLKETPAALPQSRTESKSVSQPLKKGSRKR